MNSPVRIPDHQFDKVHFKIIPIVLERVPLGGFGGARSSPARIAARRDQGDALDPFVLLRICVLKNKNYF